LAEISNLFAQNYGITLQIPDQSLTQWTISGAFKAYSADELIETLASASNLTYQRQGKTIIITQEH
jgi:ferric-dicitrate binding protein FerR (iron transport regulator)